VNRPGRVERGRTMDLAAEIQFCVVVGEGDAAFRLAQARQHFLRVVADRGDDPHTRHDDTSHLNSLINPFSVWKAWAAAPAFRLRRSPPPALRRGTGPPSGRPPDKSRRRRPTAS